MTKPSMDLSSMYNKRRKSAPQFIVISGESVTTLAAAKRLNISQDTLSYRRRQALKHLPAGETLTWEMLER